MRKVLVIAASSAATTAIASMRSEGLGMDIVLVDPNRDRPSASLEPSPIERMASLLSAPKPGPSSRASINRNTGKPHEGKREIARRLRREQGAKGGVA
jgi:hypothetical protein